MPYKKIVPPHQPATGKRMRDFAETVGQLAVVLCMTIAMSGCMVSASAWSLEVFEEASAEGLEYQEAEAITVRKNRRSVRYGQIRTEPFLSPNPRATRSEPRHAWRPTTERDQLNGIGGYLRT